MCILQLLNNRGFSDFLANFNQQLFAYANSYMAEKKTYNQLWNFD